MNYVDNTIPFTGIVVTPQIYISLNAIFVIILSPIFLKVMPMLEERNKGLSSIEKLGVGTLLITVAYLMLIIPTIISNAKIGMVWLVVFNIFLSAAEILIIPIGLSLISKLAPIRYRSLMMGILFTATAIADLISGVLASAIPLPGTTTKLLGIVEIGDLSSFLMIFIVNSAVLGILWLLSKNRIQKMMHGVE